MNKNNPLTEKEKQVIEEKGTEKSFSGEYDDFYKEGVYLCKKCSSPLFSSKNKFDAGCGWPSFDDEIEATVKRQLDPDGRRTEIVCSNCGAHLGHVFEGEGYTDKDTRHCVNSVSMKFLPEINEGDVEIAYFGGGCFWCTEAAFQLVEGVQKVTSGYAGGHVHNPDYRQVISGDTGHAEVVKVEFNNEKVSYEELMKTFFKIHDPTTVNRQGNDIGSQYRSIILYSTLEQRGKAEDFIKKLENKEVYGDEIVTEIEPLMKFYEAEEYHQDYYKKNPHNQYCQAVIKPKLEKVI